MVYIHHDERLCEKSMRRRILFSGGVHDGRDGDGPMEAGERGMHRVRTAAEVILM